MDNMYFVKTTDEATAKYLRNAGFEELPKEGSHWVFINNSNVANFFSENLKLNFSNILSV